MHETSAVQLPIEPLFERGWWIYALCRERLFTDHTEAIADAFRLLLQDGQQRHLIEVGCGPGFYARRLAARFPNLRVTGIDISERLLSRARNRAHRAGLLNCTFLRADANSLEQFPAQWTLSLPRGSSSSWRIVSKPSTQFFKPCGLAASALWRSLLPRYARHCHFGSCG